MSTALHLNAAGFTDVTVFERAPRQPSTYSAAWDLNKIVRAEYEDPFYTKLALVSLWYSTVGRLPGASSLEGLVDKELQADASLDRKR